MMPVRRGTGGAAAADAGNEYRRVRPKPLAPPRAAAAAATAARAEACGRPAVTGPGTRARTGVTVLFTVRAEPIPGPGPHRDSVAGPARRPLRHGAAVAAEARARAGPGRLTGRVLVSHDEVRVLRRRIRVSVTGTPGGEPVSQCRAPSPSPT